MDMAFYMRDPRLWEYFISLPSPVRAALLRHEVYVSSLGERIGAIGQKTAAEGASGDRRVLRGVLFFLS